MRGNQVRFKYGALQSVTLVCLLFFGASEVGAYVITDLGQIAGIDFYRYGINNSGQVAFATGGGLNYHAALWQNGTTTDLGTLGGPTSFGFAINNLGAVVGGADIYPGSHTFMWQNGIMSDLGTLAGSYSNAYAMNDVGQIVGSSTYLAGNNVPRHAYLWQNGTMTDLGFSGQSFAYGINNSGQVVGSKNNRSVPVLWENGVVTDLPITGGTSAEALAINNSGQTVGYSYTGNSNPRALLWQNGSVINLGGNTNSKAAAINNLGQIVGSFGTHAALWQNGTFVDLNDLVVGSGWTFQEADAINDNGWIVGFGSNPAGQTHVFLLTGVPEPSSMILAGLGVAGLFVRRRRRNT